jgi:hypothetical protein
MAAWLTASATARWPCKSGNRQRTGGTKNEARDGSGGASIHPEEWRRNQTRIGQPPVIHLTKSDGHMYMYAILATGVEGENLAQSVAIH